MSLWHSAIIFEILITRLSQSLIFFIRAQKNKTSHESSETTYLQIYPSALDCWWKKHILSTSVSGWKRFLDYYFCLKCIFTHKLSMKLIHFFLNNGLYFDYNYRKYFLPKLWKTVFLWNFTIWSFIFEKKTARHIF